jgi:hypothetical protein
MIAALPDLGAVAAALLLLLIAAALWVLIQLLVNTLGHAPLIGGWISRDLAGWLNDARNAILKAAGASWHAAVAMFNWGNNLFLVVFVHTATFMQEASSAVSRIVMVRIPEAVGAAYAYALGLYHSAVSYAQALEAQAVAYAASRVSALESTVQGWVAQALVYSASLASRAEAYALALVNSAEAAAANLVTESSTALRAEIRTAEQLAAGEVSALAASTQAAVSQLASDITAGVASAEAFAFSQVAALQRGIVTDLEQTGQAALQLAWPDAVPDIEALRQALGADFPDIEALLRALAGAGATGLLGALVTSLAGTATVTKLAAECIVPNCRNLGGLGRFLQSLFSDATDLALIAWLIEGVANPVGWARDTDAILGPVAADTTAVIRSLVGV